ncbi:hypothetical protein GCM10009846_18940 [Agrococcus versicolor]|uniref:Uncharacterized protein n=1 Tax=Agrococcus versicolor TaxID=501482 RepID=A0ABP5MHR8_9MICO
MLAFATRVSDTLEAVLGTGGAQLRATVLGERFEVSTVAARGIPLTARGKEILRIFVKYQCGFDGRAEYLAIHRSEFHVLGATSSEPLLRYEYVRDGSGDVPNAHLQIHAHRDAITHALVAGGNRTRRARRITPGGSTLADLKSLHLPLGGTRFRPCLEDVLHFLIEEFGVDAVDGWRSGLDAGRKEWRSLQLRSAIRDAPQIAVETLRQLGFQVSVPGDAATKGSEQTRISRRMLEF